MMLFIFHGYIQGPQKVKYGTDNVITARDIIIATGSVPFVPKGIEVDGKQLFLHLYDSQNLLRELWKRNG